MARLGRLLSALILLAPAGCRSIGRFPSIDPSDYAYVWFNGKLSQTYQFTVPQVETSVIEALLDLGYKKVDRQQRGDVVVIQAWTPDHRPTWITVRPRNHMALMTICIGLGDELASEAISQRVATNFGSLPRTFVPPEPTLETRLNRRTVSPAPKVITIPAAPLEDPLPTRAPASEPFPPPPADLLEPPPLAPGPFGPSGRAITPNAPISAADLAGATVPAVARPR